MVGGFALEVAVHRIVVDTWIVLELMRVQANSSCLEVNIQQTHAQLALLVCQLTRDWCPDSLERLWVFTSNSVSCRSAITAIEVDWPLFHHGGRHNSLERTATRLQAVRIAYHLDFVVWSHNVVDFPVYQIIVSDRNRHAPRSKQVNLNKWRTVAVSIEICMPH